MDNKVKYSEEELVELLKSSDKHTFSVIYDFFSRALLGVIKKIVVDDEFALDVLQDVFVSIWNNRQSYDASKGRLYTWMLNIARNKSVDYMRSAKNKFHRAIQHTDENVHIIDGASRSETKTDHIGLNNTIGKLTEEQRRLIQLVYFEGYTQEELSKKLEMPLGTVKTKIRNTLKLLRKTIG